MSAGRADDVEPASLCPVCIRAISATAEGDRAAGTATGFHYRDATGRNWLITTWHCLTGRRPGNPDVLLPGASQSPYRIEIVYPGPRAGLFLDPVSVDLYEHGRPIWRQFRPEAGNDLAAMALVPPAGAMSLCVQDFAREDTEPLRPGTDVTVVGFPGEPGGDAPFPVWKRAVVASDPAYRGAGPDWTLLDIPQIPGLAGSPVYRIRSDSRAARDEYEKSLAMERIEWGLLGTIEAMNAAQKMRPAAALSLVGVYVGACGDPALERLSLGTMVPAAAIGQLVARGEPGTNPYPPEGRASGGA